MKQDNFSIRFFASASLLILATFLGSYFLSRPLGSDEALVKSDESKPNPFDGIELTAKAAYVYDSRTHTVLYAKNENQKLPLASLTKVMSALVASELARPETRVTVTREALRETGDNGLRDGEKLALKDILDFSLTASSNDGMKAVALALGALSSSEPSADEAELDFVRRMNGKAEELNMNGTYYWNVTGLDQSEVKGGAYGTARDMVVLFDHVLRYKPELLEATREPEIVVRSLDGLPHRAVNTSKVVVDIPGIKASKTGYTDIAGGNWVVAFDPEVGRPIIVAVLGSTAQDRFEDVLKLMRASIEYLKQ